MSTDWFQDLFGFAETDYDATRACFALEGEELVALANGSRFRVGRFSTPTLAQLREETRGMKPGRLRVTHEAIGDVLELHALEPNEGALFQVASQFNCLEFMSPRQTPEAGVTCYANDPTQGPACALACAAATVVRNYFAEVDGQVGQTRERQIDNLAGVLAALGDAGALVEVRNGYTFAGPQGLDGLAAAIDAADLDALRGAVRVGLQTDVEVTFARRPQQRFERPTRPARVSQVFCSALSCAYSSGSLAQWQPLASLVLDAAYEATLLAAILDAERGRGSGVVWLTFLGGGAFGNSPAWIAAAISRALELCADRDLDVRVAHYGRIDEGMRAAIRVPGVPG